MWSSPALKCSSPVWNTFSLVPRPLPLLHKLGNNGRGLGTRLKHVCLHHRKRLSPVNKRTCLLFGSWLRNPLRKNRNQGKSFCNASFHVGMDPKKGIETRHEMKECKKTTPHLLSIFCRCRVVFLHSFISYLVSAPFQFHPYLKQSFAETFL